MQKFEFHIELVDKPVNSRKPFQVIHSHDNNRMLSYGGLGPAITNSISRALYHPKGTRGKITKVTLIVLVENEAKREVKNG